MKKKDLLKAMGKINEKYLIEAEERASKTEASSEAEDIVTGVEIMKERKLKKILCRLTAAAAVFILAVGTVFYIGRENFMGSNDDSGQIIQLINNMTEKELYSISSDELTLIEEKTAEHTVQIELWSDKDYLARLEENKSIYTDDEYKNLYDFYSNNVFENIHGVLIDGLYYTGFMPPYGYKGDSFGVSYSENGGAGKNVDMSKDFDTYEDFKVWYREYLNDSVSSGEKQQYEADREYEDMLIIFDSVMNDTCTILDKPIKEYLAENGNKQKWEFDADEVSEISDFITEYSIYDEELDDTFIVHVTIPPDYDQSKSYPALVLTDGVWRFGNHPSLRKMMENNEADDVILVSIGYDFTVDGTDNAVRAKYFCENRSLFLDFITDNLMPYLGECYNIDFSRSTLYGHSLGGVFTHYAAFNSDLYDNQPFGNYIIGSPAFWSPYFQPTENSAEYKTEYGYFERNASLDKNLYVCGGENEDPDYAEYYGENDSTLKGIENLLHRLEQCKVKSVVNKIYENSNHYEYIPDMLCEYLSEYI